jgi:hypothetical protein
MVVWAIFKSSTFQTFLTQKIASYLSIKTNTVVSVEEVDFEFFKTFKLNQVLVLDNKNDTMGYIGSLALEMESFNLDSLSFRFKSVTLQNPIFKIKTYANKTESEWDSFFKFLSSDDTTNNSSSFYFKQNNLFIKNGKFQIEDERFPKSNKNFNFHHFTIQNINAILQNLVISDTLYGANLLKLSLKNPKGAKIGNLEGYIYYSKNKFGGQNLKIENENTLFFADFNFSKQDSLGWETSKYQFDIKNCNLIPSDWSFYLNDLKNYNQRILLSLNAKGDFNNVKIKNLKAAFGENTTVVGKLELMDLQDINKMFIYADLQQLNSNFNDVEKVLKMVSPSFPLNDLNDLKRLRDFTFTGNFNGFIEDFVAYGELNSHLGLIVMDTKIEQIKNVVALSGNVNTESFDLGKLLNNKDLGLVNLSSSIKGRFAEKLNDVELIAQSNSFEFKKYSYNNLSAKVVIKNSKVILDCLIKDKNLNLNIDGNVDWQKNKQVFNFGATVKHAQLSKLNLLERDSSNDVSFKISVNLSGNNFKNMNGGVFLDSLVWKEKNTTFLAKKFHVQTIQEDNVGLISVNSDWLTGRVEGMFDFNNIVPSILNVLAKDLPGIVNWKYYPQKYIGKNQFRLMFRIHDFEAINHLFMPELHFPNGAIFSGRFDDLDNFIHLNFKSTDVRLWDKKINNLNVFVYNDKNRLNLDLNTDFIEIMDSVGFQNFGIKTYLTENIINYNLGWDNSKSYKNKVDITAKVDFSQIDSIVHTITQSEINFKDTILSAVNENSIVFKKNKIEVNNFDWVGGNQLVKINGVISSLLSDSLILKFQNFDLLNLEYFIKQSGVNVQGNLNGELSVLSVLNQPLFNAKLNVPNLVVNKQLFGDFNVFSQYIPNQKRVFTKITTDNLSENLQFKTLELTGNLYPFDDNKIDFELKTQNLRLQLLDKYLNGIVSGLNRGTVSGDLKISGKIKEPIVKGELTFNKIGVMVDYLNVDYYINGQTIGFDKNKILFKDFKVTNKKYKESEGYVNGEITHDYFTNFGFKINNIDFKNCIVLDTKLEDNSMYHGKAFVNGTMRVTGNTDLVEIKGDLQTCSYIDDDTKINTNLNLPLDQVDELVVSDFIDFVNLRDSSKIKKNSTEGISYQGFALDLNIGLNKDAGVKIIFDPNTGEEINVNGNGLINLNISKSGNFQMNGDYVISEGDYFFTLKKILSRKLFVKSGSSIKWNGDPLAADLDITTYYTTRSRLSSLADSITLAGFSSGQARVNTRIPVNTNIFLKGNLLKPNISMGINLPDGTAEEKEILATQIIGEDEINRQAFALIITGQFLPSRNKILNTVNNTGIDNGIAILEGQINNALGGLFNNVDLGVDYNKKDKLSAAELRLLVGFQFKRLRVQTDYDLSRNVGDVEVEYKLTNEVRAKAFHKTLEKTVLDNAMNRVQGVGLLYQKTFNNINELWRRKEELE